MTKTAERLAWDKLRETEKYRQFKKQMLEDLDYKCSYCGILLYEYITWDGLVGEDEDGNDIFAPRTERHDHSCALDHIIPLSAGGSNDFDNLVISCHNCNSKKGRKLNWIPA